MDEPQTQKPGTALAVARAGALPALAERSAAAKKRDRKMADIFDLSLVHGLAGNVILYPALAGFLSCAFGHFELIYMSLAVPSLAAITVCAIPGFRAGHRLMEDRRIDEEKARRAENAQRIEAERLDQTQADLRRQAAETLLAHSISTGKAHVGRDFLLDDPACPGAQLRLRIAAMNIYTDKAAPEGVGRQLRADLYSCRDPDSGAPALLSFMQEVPPQALLSIAPVQLPSLAPLRPSAASARPVRPGFAGGAAPDRKTGRENSPKTV